MNRVERELSKLGLWKEVFFQSLVGSGLVFMSLLFVDSSDHLMMFVMGVGFLLLAGYTVGGIVFWLLKRDEVAP